MKQFSSDYLSDLTEQEKTNDRLRQHRNVHQCFQDPCQRLFNAIEPGSYIRPHRHASDPRDELLVAIRGLMALITFDDKGTVTKVLRLGTEKYGPATCPAAEVPSDVWHTMIALESGCVLLETKAGPFDPDQPKDLAPWAPAEFSSDVSRYLKTLTQMVQSGVAENGTITRIFPH
jgi:cupin fold WbuC family metalloprotein